MTTKPILVIAAASLVAIVSAQSTSKLSASTSDFLPTSNHAVAAAETFSYVPSTSRVASQPTTSSVSPSLVQVPGYSVGSNLNSNIVAHPGIGPKPVPEPASICALAVGLVPLMRRRRRA